MQILQGFLPCLVDKNASSESLWPVLVEYCLFCTACSLSDGCVCKVAKLLPCPSGSQLGAVWLGSSGAQAPMRSCEYVFIFTHAMGYPPVEKSRLYFVDGGSAHGGACFHLCAFSIVLILR